MIYKEGETYFHDQMHGQALGIPMDLQQADAAMATEVEEVEPEVRCKACECEIYSNCSVCPYCGIKNPVEAVQQVEGIQQVATLEELKETIKQFKEDSY